MSALVPARQPNKRRRQDDRPPDLMARGSVIFLPIFLAPPLGEQSRRISRRRRDRDAPPRFAGLTAGVSYFPIRYEKIRNAVFRESWRTHPSSMQTISSSMTRAPKGSTCSRSRGTTVLFSLAR